MYSIYYSVPASDDFAMALGRDAYGNPVAEFFKAVGFFWNNRGGTIIWFIIEFLLNPLNLHIHLGHAYGIYMIVAFLLCFGVILYSVSTVFNYFLKNIEKAKLISSVITFLTAVMLIQNYYYVEAYNWYVGMVAYPMGLAGLFLVLAYLIRYSQTGNKKFLIALTIIGVIVANNTPFDVPIGIIFLYVVFLRKGFNNHIPVFIKRYIPLICFMASGLAAVTAPGNSARQGQYTEPVPLSNSLIQTFADVKYFGMLIIKERPVTFIIAAVLVIIGFAANTKAHKKPENIITLAIASFLVCFGTVLPYVYGRGMTRTYLDVRMQYVLDYFIQISICFGCFVLGQWIGYIVKTNLEKLGYIAACAVAVLGACALIVTGRYATTVSYEVYAKCAEIKASYDLWNGILLEIEQSDSDDVVVNRDYNIHWNKYFLYSGMEPGEVYAVDLDAFYDSQQILPNVYYKKNSITVNYPR
ncbi:hypothetical protein [Pseudobutyrivibrio ruminis]|nr:hypothetical protein [Pseudobutyrivibrio ruminis]